ncbi:hypothetical protein E8E12_009297 [Didymella heteroderae]|uniref:Uncharacterized protein n=1 Tax=Didymella heteroderae TaxID=1769908 RepID=A0A9P5C1H1_9PLEO|nr:hypothetical protein E8E12_009297 [Didymella heteroderae]
MVDQDQDRDPRDEIIASLRSELQLKEQREAEITKKYVDLLLELINNLPHQDQQALILLAIRRKYWIIESQVASRRAELKVPDQQFEARGIQYEQLQRRYRELSSTTNAFSAAPISQLSVYLSQGQFAGTIPPEAIP